MAEPLLTAMTLPMITAAELISSPFSFQNTENSYTARVSDLMEACQQPLVKAQRLVTGQLGFVTLCLGSGLTRP